MDLVRGQRMGLRIGSVMLRHVGKRKLVLIVGLLLTLAACSSGPQRPVLYPDAHYDAVGQGQANGDIEQCMEKARAAGVAENRDGEIGKRTGRGAAVGGVSAGAWGLVRGNAGERALAGAAAGAAAGATTGAFAATETSPLFRRFVERCLRDEGYDVIGWQ